MLPIKIPAEQKELIISNLRAFFEEERSESIGRLAAEQLIDYMLNELSPYIYNQAIKDARVMLMERMATLEDELYSLEKPLTRTRNRT